MADIDRPEVLFTNPGGTNERFDRARLHAADIVVYPDNLTIFDRQAEGDADVIIDASETRYQQKLHPNVLCAIHPDKPFDFGEKAFWMVPDPALKASINGCTRPRRTASSTRSTANGFAEGRAAQRAALGRPA
jgi:cyclohexadienyl dehydratase